MPRGIVKSDYYFDANAEGNHKHFRKIDWTDNGEWNHPGQAVMKTLTEITAYTDYVNKLEKLFIDKEEDDPEDERDEIIWPYYSKEMFLESVYMDASDYETLVGLID